MPRLTKPNGPVLGPGMYEPGEDPNDIASHAATSKRLKREYAAHRIAEGRDPEAEDQAYIDALAKALRRGE